MKSTECNASNSDINQQQFLPTNLLQPLMPAAALMEPLPDLCAAKEQLTDALKLMPESKVMAYKTALKQNPALVAKESNLYKFFQRSGYNGWETAARLCEYWTVRREVFGEERWLKPILDLTPGIGALSELSKKFIDLDAQKIMPFDKFGRPILLADRYKFSSKIKKKLGLDTNHKFEFIFYVLQLLSSLPHIGTDGFSVCYVLHDKKPEIYPQVHKFFSKVVRECFPIRMNTVNVVFAPLKENKDKSFVQTFMPYLFECLKLPLSFTRVKLDYLKPPEKSTSMKAYRKNLADFLVQRCNMKSEFLPAIAGGKWNFLHFLEFNKSRQDNGSLISITHPLPQHWRQHEVKKEIDTTGSTAVSSRLDLLAYAALQTASPLNSGIKREGPQLDIAESKKKQRSGL